MEPRSVYVRGDSTVGSLTWLLAPRQGIVRISGMIQRLPNDIRIPSYGCPGCRGPVLMRIGVVVNPRFLRTDIEIT